ncbi:hypothetical protein, variant [Phytophthora nicotianae P1976]|uniref:Uncharacterized protein n=1 Tax=Phytophthora nicotianae P1976 TaxID=1317066 RepID=A0A080Z6D6_PHYNI|nr:hypothetical protein, variant [Phytophthora nicotianae P1976]
MTRFCEDEERCSNKKKTAPLAITGGHAEVVAYMLQYSWNAAFYFMEAVGTSNLQSSRRLLSYIHCTSDSVPRS